MIGKIYHMNNNINKYIYENQQTFITGYDIYNTIVHLLYGDNYNSIQNKTKASFEIPKIQKVKAYLWKLIKN